MKKRSLEEWRELFAQQEASGVSAAVFCKQNELCPKHFSVRRKQLGWKASELDTGFVRAQIKAEVAANANNPEERGASLVVHCAAGQLAFGVLPQPDWLAQLVKALA